MFRCTVEHLGMAPPSLFGSAFRTRNPQGALWSASGVSVAELAPRTTALDFSPSSLIGTRRGGLNRGCSTTRRPALLAKGARLAPAALVLLLAGCADLSASLRYDDSVEFHDVLSKNTSRGYVAFVRITNSLCRNSDKRNRVNPTPALLPEHVGLFEVRGDKLDGLAATEGYWSHSNLWSLTSGLHTLRVCYMSGTGETHWEDDGHQYEKLGCWEGAEARVRDVEVKITENKVAVVNLRDDVFFDCAASFVYDTDVRANFVIENVRYIPWGGVPSEIPEVVNLLKESEVSLPTPDGLLASLAISRDDLLRILAFDDLCKIGRTGRQAALSAIEPFLPSRELGHLANKVRDLVTQGSSECLVSRWAKKIER